uniref:Reticulon 4 receptor-like 2 a n=1 Tax=Neogobius melanostomus TaxID=47308 RepID=A0A8C6WK15_9GOBI
MVLGKPGPASACPQNCVCYPTPMTVSCQAQNFTAVPVGVPYESQRVFLQNNRITELRVGSFGFGTQVLWLFSNNITWIEAGAFSELRDLEELDLGDNPSLHRLEGGLTALPHDIFHKLYSLQFLYLQVGELLMQVDDDIFSDLINLSQLFIHGNRIRTLSENVFRGLVNLDRLLLHDNRIRQVNRRAFRDLGRLTMLFLFNNSLAELPGQTLRDLQGIEFLRLNANPWSCGCESRPVWEWFREVHVSSSEVICASPPIAATRTCAFFGKWTLPSAPCLTRLHWWVNHNHLQHQNPLVVPQKQAPIIHKRCLALPKLDPEEYWANYGNEDSGISVRCFELECPPEFDTPSSSSPAPSVLSILSLSLLTVPIHLLFG